MSDVEHMNSELISEATRDASAQEAEQLSAEESFDVDRADALELQLNQERVARLKLELEAAVAEGKQLGATIMEKYAKDGYEMTSIGRNEQGQFVGTRVRKNK